MVYLLTALFILVCLFLIIVVLLQSGKAADLAGAFGGMGSQTVFGPRGSASVLSNLDDGGGRPVHGAGAQFDNPGKPNGFFQWKRTGESEEPSYSEEHTATSQSDSTNQEVVAT